MIKTDIVFLICDTPTQNGRIYPEAEIRNALVMFQRVIDADVAYGYNVTGSTSQTWTLSELSHRVKRVELRGGQLIGDIEILPTTQGLRLQAIIDHPDTQFGVHGAGFLDTQGIVNQFALYSINYFIESQADKAKQTKQTNSYNYNRAMGIVKK